MDRLEGYTALSFHQLRNLLDLEVERYRRELLGSEDRYKRAENLNRYEFSIFSQCGEDGIINEIFNRIGLTNHFFVEFGAGNGLQNCTTALLLQNWFGLWIENAPANVQVISSKFSSFLVRHQLTFLKQFITAENIESIFREADIPAEFDLLSIDLDGNDYWVWNAIENYSPRVVVCEYNGHFGSDIKWVMKYNPQHVWNGSSYYGASLKSLELLGSQKGYQLVGCNLSGVNAFFVRQDLAEGHFLTDGTSATHYEPLRHFLIREPVVPNDFGPFQS